MKEVVFFLACYGLTFTLCDAGIFDRPRQILARVRIIKSLLQCYFCTGFWVSAVWWVVLFSGLLNGTPEPQNWPVTAAWGSAYALAGATFSYGLDVALTVLERNLQQSWVDRDGS